uniref:Uncharacterized protein n=1 Tax=Amphimedon queenslandica TaxID=400682 RepID=A0A1X7VFB9_AMPQE
KTLRKLQTPHPSIERNESVPPRNTYHAKRCLANYSPIQYRLA